MLKKSKPNLPKEELEYRKKSPLGVTEHAVGKRREILDMIVSKSKTDFNIQKIPVSDIIVEEQVRQYIDKASIESLAKSIEKKGLIQPIVVAQREDGAYLLVSGHRRLEAVKNVLNRKTIEAVVLPYEPSYIDRKILQIYENIFRDDLSFAEYAFAVGEISYMWLCDIISKTEIDVEAMKMKNYYINLFGGIPDKLEFRKYVASKYYFFHIDRLKEEERLFVDMIADNFDATHSRVSAIFYIWCEGEDIKDKLCRMRNLNAHHFLSFMRYKLTKNQLLKYAEIANRNELSVRELNKILGLRFGKKLKDNTSSISIDSVFRRIDRIFNKVMKDKAVLQNDEIRERLIRKLELILTELKSM